MGKPFFVLFVLVCLSLFSISRVTSQEVSLPAESSKGSLQNETPNMSDIEQLWTNFENLLNSIENESRYLEMQSTQQLKELEESKTAQTELSYSLERYAQLQTELEASMNNLRQSYQIQAEKDRKIIKNQKTVIVIGSVTLGVVAVGGGLGWILWGLSK